MYLCRYDSHVMHACVDITKDRVYENSLSIGLHMDTTGYNPS